MNSTEKPGKLNFTPVSEGLGFHPFSDGLPYAPVGRQGKPTPAPSNQMGTGAISAGPSTFAFPKAPVISQPFVPVSRPEIPKQPTFTAPSSSTQSLTSPIGPSTATAPDYASQAEKESLLEDQPGLVFLLKRVFAFGVDLTLNGILISAGWLAALWDHVQEWDFFFQPAQLKMIFLLFLVFQWGLMALQEVALHTTFGKRVFGLRLQGSPTALFIRSFLYYPSLAFSAIGIFWALFDSQKRCWHDRAAGVRVFEIARL